MSSKKLTCVCLAFFLVSCQLPRLEADQLKIGYYSTSCSDVETIVRDEVRRGFIIERGLAAGLVRMHFHDCFVRGCDGSVLIDSTPSNKAEKDAPPNNPSLRGFEIIDNAKTRLEFVCQGIVSCADILAFAARDSTVLTGGQGWDVPAGRKDGRVSLASEASANLPGPSSNLNKLTQSFAGKGLTQEEMVTLSGAHTIGRSHCTSFSSRLFGFNTTLGQDSTLDGSYAAQLRLECPQGSTDPDLVVPMDPFSPTIMDTSYYMDVQANQGLFTSDQTLMTDEATANQVRQNAMHADLWQSNFARAMVKMGNIGVLTGDAGEIRANCRIIN